MSRHGIVAAGLVVVTILTPFLVVSESTIKKHIDGWLNDCVVVFEVDEVKGKQNRLFVKGYAQGKLPNALPLTFAARKAEINTVSFLNHLDLEGTDPYANLSVHPQANASCPGPLCEGVEQPSPIYMTILLVDVHPSFVYPFYVDFNGKVSDANLRLFVQYQPGLKEGVCRVERANAFNLFVRMTKLGQFGLAIIIFVAVTILIAFARILTRGDQS